jgi:probable F420-dependent oxidoreductase
MKFGTGFSLSAGADGADARELARAYEKAGLDFVTSSHHIMAAADGTYPDRPKPTYVGPFRDPFVMFSHLAAVTERLEFMTSVLLLPLFPAALVAKQSADLSLLSGGRFHLGVGISWNPIEYQALGQDFRNRAARMEEQIALMRRLWSEPYVEFAGKYHTIGAMGLNQVENPPVPIWIAAGLAEPALRRVAKMADGWMPFGDAVAPSARLAEIMAEEGRDPATLLKTGRITAGPEGAGAWIDAAHKARETGVTHLTIGLPPGTPTAQGIDTLTQATEALRGAIH